MKTAEKIKKELFSEIYQLNKRRYIVKIDDFNWLLGKYVRLKLHSNQQNADLKERINELEQSVSEWDAYVEWRNEFEKKSPNDGEIITQLKERVKELESGISNAFNTILHGFSNDAKVELEQLLTNKG